MQRVQYVPIPIEMQCPLVCVQKQGYEPLIIGHRFYLFFLCKYPSLVAYCLQNLNFVLHTSHCQSIALWAARLFDWCKGPNAMLAQTCCCHPCPRLLNLLIPPRFYLLQIFVAFAQFVGLIDSSGKRLFVTVFFS